MGTDRPSPMAALRPVTSDIDTGGFWEAARRGQLAVQKCMNCDSVLFLPRARCRRCGSFDTDWVPVQGKGRLYSWTVVEHQTHPKFPVPYTVVLVELDDAPTVRLVGHLPGAPDLVPGQAMRARFDTLDDGETVLPQWEPA